MTIVNLNKVIDFYINKIRDELNFHEKIELSRLILSGIEYDHEKTLLKKYKEALSPYDEHQLTYKRNDPNEV